VLDSMDRLAGQATAITHGMSTLKYLGIVVLLLSITAIAQEAPEAPHAIVDKKFVALSGLSIAATFADSYTTTWARQNWQGGKTGVCNIERESAYLYGTHPTAERAYAVAAGKSVIAVAAAYYLRKHNRKFWGAPLVVNSIFGLQGTAQNMVMCN
jgi:hypothetical protein